MASKILAEELQSGSMSLSINSGTDIGLTAAFDASATYSAGDKVKYRPSGSTGAYSVYEINYDTEASQLPANGPEVSEWTGTADYSSVNAYDQGDKVDYNGNSYMAHIAHTAGGADDPGTNSDHWGLASEMFTNITLRIDGFAHGDVVDTRTMESVDIRLALEESADSETKEVFSTEDGWSTQRTSIDARIAAENAARGDNSSGAVGDSVTLLAAAESGRNDDVVSIDARWASEVSTWDSSLSEEEGSMTYIASIPLTTGASNNSGGDDNYSINANGNVVTVTYPSRSVGVAPGTLSAFATDGVYAKGDHVSYDSKSWQALSALDGSGSALTNPGVTAGEWEDITTQTVPSAVASLRMLSAGYDAGAPMLMCMGQGTPTATTTSFVLSAAPENDDHYMMDVAIAI